MSRQRSSNGHSRRGIGASPRTPGPHRSSPGIPWNSRRVGVVSSRIGACNRSKGADFTCARDPRRSLQSVHRATRHATGVQLATWYAASARCTLHASCMMHISHGARSIDVARSMVNVAWWTQCTPHAARRDVRCCTLLTGLDHFTVLCSPLGVVCPFAAGAHANATAGTNHAPCCSCIGGMFRVVRCVTVVPRRPLARRLQ